jgi:hypothetical protein
VFCAVLAGDWARSAEGFSAVLGPRRFGALDGADPVFFDLSVNAYACY